MKLKIDSGIIGRVFFCILLFLILFSGVTRAQILENSGSGGGSFVIDDGKHLYEWGPAPWENLAWISQPTLVTFPDGVSSVESIGAGGNFAAALVIVGNAPQIYAWDNQNDELYLNKRTPDLLPQPPGGVVWNSVAAGGLHILATTRDGRVFAMGIDRNGQVGTDDTAAGRVASFTEVHIPGSPKIEYVSGSAYSSIAISNTGALYVWGEIPGDTGIWWHPHLIPNPPGVHGWKSAAINWGRSNDCLEALSDDGVLYDFGGNAEGELGLGDTLDRSSWTQVPFPPGVQAWKKVVTGEAFTLALTSSGELYSWGYNYYGQLGTGDTKNSSVPVQIGLDRKWDDIGVSTLVSFGLSDCKLFDWGNNSEYSIGNPAIHYSTQTLPWLADTVCTLSSVTKKYGSVTVDRLQVFPNPATDVVSVSYETMQDGSVLISIYDILGNLKLSTKEQKLSQGRHLQTFDCSGLSKGIYYCRIVTSSGIATERFELGR